MINIHLPHPTDALSAEEFILYDLIMNYRIANGLPTIPLSKALTTTAGRHALDTVINFGVWPQGAPGENKAHSWSDAPYDGRNPATWPNMWDAPERLGTGYTFNGYEISAGTWPFGGRLADGDITPAGALRGWQTSPAHNNVILSREGWARPDLQWDAIGIGIYAGVAHLWFGADPDPTGPPPLDLDTFPRGQIVEPALLTGSDTGTDFDGNARAEVLWRGQGGEVAVWQMAGGAVVGMAMLTINPGSYWAVVGAGDFGGDGRADILWRGRGDEVAVWQMEGSQVASTRVLAMNPGRYWEVAGTGDFNANGTADILWRGRDGEVAVWQMNGSQISATSVLAMNPGHYWGVAGTGDFNGNGTTDILWRGQGGEVAVWQMSGSQIASTTVLAMNPGRYWQIAAAGDFDGAGTADILWRGQGGEVAVWHMAGSQIVSTAVLAMNPGSYWEIAGAADFGGDGRADILWRGQGGEVAVWEMAGSHVASAMMAPLNPGQYWDALL